MKRIFETNTEALKERKPDERIIPLARKKYLEFKIISILRYNKVTCGRCGRVIDSEKGVPTIKCYHCGYFDDACHFPDDNH